MTISSVIFLIIFFIFLIIDVQKKNKLGIILCSSNIFVNILITLKSNNVNSLFLDIGILISSAISLVALVLAIIKLWKCRKFNN